MTTNGEHCCSSLTMIGSVVLIFILIARTFAAANSQVFLDQVKYDFDTKLATGQIWIVNNRTINFEFDLFKNIQSMDLIHRIQLYLGRRAFLTPVNETISYCEKMSRLKKNKLWTSINLNFFANSNFPQKCPIPKNKYYVRNFTFPNEVLPSYMPKVQFKLETVFIHRNDLGENMKILEFSIFGRVVG